MRSILLNRTNTAVLGNRQDRSVAGKEKLCALVRASSFFSRHALRASQGRLSHVMRQAAMTIARAAQRYRLATEAPAQDRRPHTCWHPSLGLPHASAGMR